MLADAALHGPFLDRLEQEVVDSAVAPSAYRELLLAAGGAITEEVNDIRWQLRTMSERDPGRH